jgi:hypothetical protein
MIEFSACCTTIPWGGLPDIARIECTTMTSAAYAGVKLDPRKNTTWMYRNSENLMTRDKPEKNRITRMKAPECHLADVPEHQNTSRAIYQSLKRFQT